MMPTPMPTITPFPTQDPEFNACDVAVDISCSVNSLAGISCDQIRAPNGDSCPFGAELLIAYLKYDGTLGDSIFLEVVCDRSTTYVDRPIQAGETFQFRTRSNACDEVNFIVYTSGSTGKPKGVLHTTGGYMVYASMTHQYLFNYKPKDIYWCTADIGWVTGHSYIIYGPLANGATTIMFEGIPNYPDSSRWWQIVDKYKVNIFYTAPTAIRALMREGDKPVKKTSRKSLKLLGTVGEPINPEAWMWYHDIVGGGRCPIVDTWFQTETGGILITPLPGATATKPGSATQPFFGIKPVLVDGENNELDRATDGNLCLQQSWPGQMRTVYGDHQRFIETYFTTFPGRYFTGDGARRDGDGYYWITGRVDDVLNVSGHRMGTAEVESALVAHPKVAEAAVVGYPHDVKGQGIYAYVTLVAGLEPDLELEKSLKLWVGKEIGLASDSLPVQEYLDIINKK